MAQALQEAFERCLKRYPTVQLTLDEFRARIDDIVSREMGLPDEQSRMDAVARIHCEDLFLATACSRQDRIAWEYFADIYLPLLRNFSARACGSPDDGEDLAQEIITKLLKEQNHLAGYNGRGSLAGWLRAAVSHAAVDRFRRKRKQISLEDLPANSPQPALTDPGTKAEEEIFDARWSTVISGIANEIVSRLPARDRVLLGLYYLRGVTLQTIRKQLGIHEATASRWLEKLRRDIRKQVEAELRKKHGLRSSEIQSLWNQISVSSVAGPIAEALSAATGPGAMEGEDAGAGIPKKNARRDD
ncbi:MAG: sigma-70 family polymerase sigma factor [Acidobacteria bacterium]|nr:sigma-70 family polymerase sigma factor [Acidobacteriota bacterium]